jgi:gamma-glutamylcyclotransferase (GGCT)/AIG2-like uncharacterized protein YtfP
VQEKRSVSNKTTTKAASNTAIVIKSCSLLSAPSAVKTDEMEISSYTMTDKSQIDASHTAGISASPMPGSPPKHSENGPRPVFIYGTLCAVPLLAWVMTGDAERTADISGLLQPALVYGYKRVAIKHADYPAAVEDDSACLKGMLLKPATRSQRRKLDDFEGEVYRISSVQVTVLKEESTSNSASNTTSVSKSASTIGPTKETKTVPMNDTCSETIEADLYVWDGEAELLTSEPWDLQKFINERLKDWLDIFEGMELIGED